MDMRAMQLPPEPPRPDMFRPTHDDEIAYAAGWTISGVATLATIIAVWIFAI